MFLFICRKKEKIYLFIYLFLDYETNVARPWWLINHSYLSKSFDANSSYGNACDIILLNAQAKRPQNPSFPHLHHIFSFSLRAISPLHQEIYRTL